MLSKYDIETIVNLRLADVDLMHYLEELTPDQVDLETLRNFVEIIRGTLGEKEAKLHEALGDTIDCAGTGGSGLAHFNTSTTAAFVLAAGGLTVTKFGNRGATSASGSFDLLRELGFPLGLPADEIPELLHETGIVFLFAPQFYPVFAKFVSARKAFKERTVFNFLGPLLNPVRPSFRLLGVSEPAMQELIAQFISEQEENKKTLVVRAETGLDEIDADCANDLIEVNGGISRKSVYKTDFEVRSTGGMGALTPEENKSIFLSIISGEDKDSRYRRLVCLNAGAGFYAAGLGDSIDKGVELAEELIKSGAVRGKFENSRSAYAKYLG